MAHLKAIDQHTFFFCEPLRLSLWIFSASIIFFSTLPLFTRLFLRYTAPLPLSHRPFLTDLVPMASPSTLPLLLFSPYFTYDNTSRLFTASLALSFFVLPFSFFCDEHEVFSALVFLVLYQPLFSILN